MVLYICCDTHPKPCIRRGNHETGGSWAFGKFTNDVDDIDAVVAHLRREYGYVVDMLVGHSRGSVAAMLWLCKHKDGHAKDVKMYVNVSGRFRMEVGFSPYSTTNPGFTKLRSTKHRKSMVSNHLVQPQHVCAIFMQNQMITSISKRRLRSKAISTATMSLRASH